MRVSWTRRALEELEAIGDFVAIDNPHAADRLLRRIQDRVAALQQHPGMGRVGRVAGTREPVIFGTPYVVAYRSEPDRVEIVAVVHGARRWPKRF